MWVLTFPIFDSRNQVGGKDLDHNVRLVSAISKAKDLGFSKDGIEYALAKGINETGASSLEDISYEG
jgi:transcriptional/translational regulatory protein YebC/TACO1